jgi:predicted nucleotidyltransferase
VKFETRTAQVCAALNATGARYLVMGGTAVVLHGYVRATTDVAILIGRTLENARAVLEALRGIGYGFASEWLPEEILAKPITVIGDDPQVDIFTVAWSVKYEDAVARSSIVELDGVPVPLMSIDDLITSKKSTGRALDQNDVEALEKIKRIRGRPAG